MACGPCLNSTAQARRPVDWRGPAATVPAATVIDKSDMMEVLIRACPSFGPTWEKLVADWQNEPGAPLYIALGELARHLVHKLEAGDIGEFAETFAAIERLQREGVDYVQEAAVVGLLEGLQNRNLHRRTSPDDFLPFLAPLSRVAWDDLMQFWEGTTPKKHER